MDTIRFTRRVLAAAAALSGIAFAVPASAATLTCTSATFQASPDGLGNITVSCASPTSGSTCTLSGNTSQIPSSGGSVALTASCGTVSSWKKDGVAINAVGNSFTDTYATTTSPTNVSHQYLVTGSNGTSNTFTVTQLAAGSTAPPSGTVAQACAAAGYSTVQVVEMAWSNARYLTSKFSPTSIVVFHFRTPSGTSPGTLGQLAGAEYGGGPKLRHAVLSDTPCDFNHSFIPYDYSDNTTVSINYYVGGSQLYYPVLQPSRDYYLNVKNDPKACTSSYCEMYMDFVRPAGL